jgi:esterase/lipase superfamily enzyme
MSGFYDLEPDYLRGYADDNCYFNNPLWYVRDLGGEPLHALRTAAQIAIVSGQGAYEAPEASRRLSRVLDEKQIPHVLDLWGHDVKHDWPWWRRMLPFYIAKMFG